MRGRTVVLLVLFLVACGVLVVSQRDDGSAEPRFCPADGLIDADGRTYGRGGPDCRFVDEDGKELTEWDGEPLCYDEYGRVPAFGADCR